VGATDSVEFSFMAREWQSKSAKLLPSVGVIRPLGRE
jgi:hypothetical protein